MKWDERHWQFALKSDKPVQTYQEIKSDIASQKNSIDVSQLSKEEQDWLRNAG